MHHSPWRDQYRHIVDSISDSLDFFEAMSGSRVHEASRAPFYASHEALHLHYEQAQARYIERQGRWYNLSTHLPWIGMRTAELGGAHVEFCRGIANPVGVKVGPSMDTAWVRGLCEVLNPTREPGRLVLIHRMGAAQVDAKLPPLIEAVRVTGVPVLWVCDPMHGNTETIASGIKTRRFENIVTELESAFKVHREVGSYLGGVHFELTGDNVTECLGGALRALRRLVVQSLSRPGQPKASAMRPTSRKTRPRVYCTSASRGASWTARSRSGAARRNGGGRRRPFCSKRSSTATWPLRSITRAPCRCCGSAT